MADGRYPKIKVYDGSNWKAIKELKVYDGSKWVSFGANLDTKNTNALRVYNDSNRFVDVLQRYYTRTEQSGEPYLYTNSSSAFLYNGDDTGFQVSGTNFDFECEVARSTNRDMVLWQSVSNQGVWGYTGYNVNSTNWAIVITWGADGYVRVRIKWGDYSDKRTGDNTYVSRVANTNLNSKVHVHVWFTSSSQYLGNLSIQVGYGDPIRYDNISTTLEGNMQNRINPEGGLKIYNMSVTCHVYGGPFTRRIDVNNYSNYNWNNHQEIYKQQDYVTVGYWQ